MNNLCPILYTHSVAPHEPRKVYTVGSSFLLYEDRSKEPYSIHWLDCNETKPKFLKEKSFTTSLQTLWVCLQFKMVPRNWLSQLLQKMASIATAQLPKAWNGEWQEKLPGMQKVLYPVHITTDGRGHLFVSDGVNGNRCIQMFSVSDGQYMGCLIKEGEQGLGHPNTICWHSASHSLAVVLLMDCFWSLSVINMEYWFQFFWLYFNHSCIM